ncbi:hydantoinase/oxoprolinase family protein [Selenihalanaerobacter shriftii]|uniref:N-methylhydantoinase A/oxoprolinase/acetone carboxylase, beta subunit n=1 Tax=Selenihalanaerobacter shriftii TaxID=142842 RepID=A0A1T4Q0G2_9FIRM|nr:hydantoinase/oxoprolinase family protein [Selenihalanaerobacter shriftii]SJZ97272.1 N-methylhydantoinase A/oxoprolinase/acetone carboxylase, beta subunit [Selenihalanaerobacter shriftii]
MKLGIDIGGTHTDGVLLNDNNEIIKSIKLTTQHQELTNTILTGCQTLTSNLKAKELDRIVLSTTLATNVIAEQNYQPAGLLLIPGPGINPKLHNYAQHVEVVTGSIDHRGSEVQDINKKEVQKTLAKFIKIGIDRVGVCGKFSTRNPKHELEIKNLIKKEFTEIEVISLSHQLTGRLNYPRRIATTYLNCLVQQTQTEFTTAIQDGLKELNIKSPVYILKADGGTMPLIKSNNLPVESINSGPAASIMGILALTDTYETTLGIDIGGTTTDISLFIDKEPLFKPKGIKINKYKTSIRGLYNKSVDCGGDSLIQIKNGKLKIGPKRQGPAAAFGGNNPTPTDALVILNLTQKGNKEAAKTSLQPLAKELNLSIPELANKIIKKFCQEIKAKIDNILTELNNQPVYTINKLLDNTNIQPTKLVGIGGPAKALTPRLASELNMDYITPDNANIANAIGAALSRVTQECTLYADTSQGYYNIPELSIKESINQEFNLQIAQSLIKEKLRESTITPQKQIEISNTETFNLVRGFNTIGKIIKVTAQLKPGLITWR